ncbi:GPI inositol-deacylase isoform X2 [Sarcophilus harrisii]|uniref:GPI inositol-deacylase isoform X2 n=1 Tax=Sarcophilus harrisii TaxID=9305 RepID=UPI001301B168|nr:GPI inositol-deacylase isoform X2 [Sarcophilus harrisii]
MVSLAKAWTVTFYGALALMVALGIWDVFFGYEENKCSMSYMFEYPEYQKISLPHKLTRQYPAYELYLYGEGSYAQENKNLLLSGIPVLFLPGNAGSYKQVRSLGSIALRKAEDIDFKYHFDFFSVNFNEELVALYGGSLKKQTKFVHECIKIILKLYEGQDFAPKSVAIVGHSMGGLVARALLTLKNFKPELVNLLVTQATPHTAPVMSLDSYLNDFYKTVNNYWILNAQDIKLSTLSIAGGFRDYQVRSGLSSLTKLSQQTQALSVVSTAVPRTWASTDHLSIVWCKQLQLATIRAFFDLIDDDTKQITMKPKKKMAVLNHHFIKYPAKPFEEIPNIVADLTGTSKWVPVKVTKWTFMAFNESYAMYFAFPLSNHRKTYTHIYCRNSMLDTQSWIYGCINSVSMCTQGVDLSWKTELLPTMKTFMLKLQDYPKLSHLVVYVPSTNGNKFVVDCELFHIELRTVQLPVTHLFSFGLTSRQIKLNSNGLFYTVPLMNFGQIYQAFKIDIKSKCASTKEKNNVFRLHIPWSHEDMMISSKAPTSTEISLKLHVAQPENDSHVAVFHMFTSSDCRYEITVRTSFLQILGQIIRFHGGALPAYIMSSILLTYGGQLQSLISVGHCLDYTAMLDREAKPYKVDPFVIIMKFMLGYNWFKEIWDSFFLPELDAIFLNTQSMCFPLVSLVLFLFGTSIAYWGGILSSLSVRLLSSLWLTLNRSSEIPNDSRLITTRLLFLIMLLLIIGWTTCGALAILLIYLYYVFKIINLYSNITTLKNNSDVMQNIPGRNENDSNSSIEETEKNDGSQQNLPPKPNVLPIGLAIDNAEDNFKMHITIVNLVIWIVFLSMPSLIYWLKNLRYYIRLNPDPCKHLSFFLVPTLGILGNSDIVSIKSSKLLKTAAQFPLIVAIGVVAFGSTHLYRVPYFVVIPLLLHMLSNI